jgi:DNA-directed RNA polymerase subunit beta
MPISATRYIKTDTIRNLGVVRDDFEIADLTRIQTESYARFLQLERGPRERKSQGLEEILREVFPIESYDGQYRLEYLRYELGKPRYTPTECRQLRLTYGRPFRVWLRLVKEQPIEEEVYLGDMPIMLGGGEFIINGAERVVVSQLHRSPGVDFVLSSEPGERKNYSCRIIPERGSWIELVVSKKEALGVRIDQSGKFSAMTLLRAMSPEFSTDSALIRLFYETAKVKVTKGDHAELVDKISVEDVVYPIKDERSGEIVVECGHMITEAHAIAMAEAGIKSIEIVPKLGDALVLNSIMEDRAAHQAASKEMTPSHESA